MARARDVARIAVAWLIVTALVWPIALPSSANALTTTELRDRVVATALAQLGDAYLYGAEGPDRFDCSGLVYYSYAQNGISIPRPSRSQYAGAVRFSNRAGLLPGDLCFIDAPDAIHHVGIFVGEGRVVHSPSSGDVVKVVTLDQFAHGETLGFGRYLPADYVTVPGPATRLSGEDRYETSVALARKAFPGWTGVTDVVVASGEDRAAADPLAAAGLCWAYDAPLLLVSSRGASAAVKTALKEIVRANGSVTVHVVGGPVAVGNAVVDSLCSAAGTGATWERLLATGDRFDTAAEIAQRITQIDEADSGRSRPNAVLVANGLDPATFTDALSLSSVAAAQGTPVLLVGGSHVPTKTADAVRGLEPGRVIVGGGPNTIDDATFNALGDIAGVSAERWSGSDRYSTAAWVASRAVSAGWLDDVSVGIAAKLPDALAGGSMIGRAGGVLLLAASDRLPKSTASWLSAHESSIAECWVFGGPVSVHTGVMNAANQALQ